MIKICLLTKTTQDRQSSDRQLRTLVKKNQENVEQTTKGMRKRKLQQKGQENIKHENTKLRLHSIEKYLQ